tara:strand:+ start:42 stop:575 length:534 start_codon:yes stop_codon:yes gene_type:complete
MTNQLDLFIDENVIIDYESIDMVESVIYFGDGGKRKRDLNDTSYFIASVPKDKYTIYKSGSTHQLPMYNGRKDFPFIRNNITGNIIKPNFSRAVYPCYTIDNGKISKRVYAHRIFAMSFVINNLPNDNFNVDHINEDKLDYSVDNLRWVSVSENMRNIKNKAKTSSGQYKVYGSTFV